MSGSAPDSLEWNGAVGDRRDDVDRLFARLESLPAPRSLVANVLLATRLQRPLTIRTLIWAGAEVVALVALALIAFAAGQAMVGGGALALLAAAFTNADVVFVAPADVLLAIAEAIPWIELLALAAGGVVVALLTRGLARSLSGPQAPGLGAMR